MKVTLKSAVICAAIWLAIKMIGYYLGFNEPKNLSTFVFTNILFLLVAISTGIYFSKLKSEEDDTMLTDIKNGMKSGVVYSLIVSAFLYFYYEKIDTAFYEKMKVEREYKFIKSIDDPAELKRLKDSDPKLEVMTKEEIIEKYRETPNILFSGTFAGTFNMLALLMLSTIYSILVTVIMRKVVFR